MMTFEAIQFLKKHLQTLREIDAMLVKQSIGMYRPESNHDVYRAIETLINHIECKNVSSHNVVDKLSPTDTPQ